MEQLLDDIREVYIIVSISLSPAVSQTVVHCQRFPEQSKSERLHKKLPDAHMHANATMIL